MRNGPVFISHATSDDAFVHELRRALEGLHIPVRVDSRNLRGGDVLAPNIAQAIEQARQVIVILSPHTINSIIYSISKEVMAQAELEGLSAGATAP